MNKPEWKDAPEWAMWLAGDKTTDLSHPESWVWFENKPRYHVNGWMFGPMKGRWLQTKNHIPLMFDAENSLEPRPC